MSLLSVPMLFHAEFEQHLLLGVMKGEVKDLILKLYQLIQKNKQGMVWERRAERAQREPCNSKRKRKSAQDPAVKRCDGA